jgi:hypothetical protein
LDLYRISKIDGAFLTDRPAGYAQQVLTPILRVNFYIFPTPFYPDGDGLLFCHVRLTPGTMGNSRWDWDLTRAQNKPSQRFRGPSNRPSRVACIFPITVRWWFIIVKGELVAVFSPVRLLFNNFSRHIEWLVYDSLIPTRVCRKQPIYRIRFFNFL